MIREVLDLSTTIESLSTPVFPGYPQPLKSTFTTIAENGYLSHIWSFAEHTGTHVDAPAHFIKGGLTVDKVPISTYVGNGVVLDFSNKPPKYAISKDDMRNALKAAGNKDVGPGWILFFYTGYTSKGGTPEWMDHPELSEEACKFIVQKKVNAIGFDAPSPDRGEFPAHHILLPEKIAIFESLKNLEKLLNKDFIFVGAPLPLVGGSASPVRALAIILS